MNLQETILAILTVVSTLLAVYSIYRERLARTQEKATEEILKSTVLHLSQSLGASLAQVDGIIQLGKTRKMSASELVDKLRLVRVNLAAANRHVKDLDSSTPKVSWRYDAIFPSGQGREDSRGEAQS